MNEFKVYYNFFDEEEFCVQILKNIRQQQGVVCKKCENETHYWKNDKKKFECKKCNYRTSLKKDTIMENSNLPLQYWLSVIVYLNTTGENISALNLQKKLGHNRYEPIWLMLKKIKKISKTDLLNQISIIEHGKNNNLSLKKLK
ncbi:MAG: hypothetical protein B7C24_06600 [Bacteroidetes bacterium 4572_77]|nr:MAG: hypothetical protein B7C24_06600 [Bacteroidetes bacterium 4572_77]